MDPIDANPSRKARIEIIPLIDVIFFLLATFVLFTLSLEKIRMLDVGLPSGDSDGKNDAIHLQASANGTFYWKEGSDGAPELLTSGELRPRLQSYVRSAAAPRVFIRSDRSASFGDGVFALDEVRRAGIRQVSIETISSATAR